MDREYLRETGDGTSKMMLSANIASIKIKSQLNLQTSFLFLTIVLFMFVATANATLVYLALSDYREEMFRSREIVSYLIEQWHFLFTFYAASLFTIVYLVNQIRLASKLKRELTQAIADLHADLHYELGNP